MDPHRVFHCLCPFLAGLLIGTSAANAKLSVYPPKVQLSAAQPSQRILSSWEAERGEMSDVSAEVQWQVDPPEVVRIENGVVAAIAPGSAHVVASFRGDKVSVAVEVRDLTNVPRVGFQQDVVPILTRFGCNAGTCHGSSRGQDGFRLSLFGFDPRGDYHRITREQATRRIQLAEPNASLLLEKAVGAVPHTGGKRFEIESEPYRVLRRWLEEEALWDEGAPTVVAIHLYPPSYVLEASDRTLPICVMAEYSDQTWRDVTALSIFATTEDTVAKVTPELALVGKQRGEAFLTARFDVHTVGIPVLVLPPGAAVPTIEESDHYIDQLVAKKLVRLRETPGPLCSDEEFLRRATIDAIGLLPTVDERAAFLADPAPDKRAQWIERLLARPEFHQLWSAQWADLLMIREIPNVISGKGAQIYTEWLREQFANELPLDQLVFQLLTSTGDNFVVPTTNFYTVEPDRLKMAENVAQLFLGIRLQCAQCHNHPFDRWTMNDYYGFADFFSGVQRKPHEDYRQWTVRALGGQTLHPITGQAVPSKYLGGTLLEDRRPDRRLPLAEWMIAVDNPYFARNLANRVWAHFFGRGLVEPVDDVRISNPPSNQELLDTLATKLVEYGFQHKALVRDILNSHAYQRRTAGHGEPTDTRNNTHAAFRRIPATQLLDCIAQVTEAPDKFRGLPLGTRAVLAWDQVPESYFLKTFGRTERASVCACGSNAEPTLSQALHLINGSIVHAKIVQGGVVARWLEQGKQPVDVIRDLYIRCLSREPTATELEQLLPIVTSANSPTEGLEDVFWAILNSKEFLFNH